MTSHVPPTPESESITSCGFPQNYNASKEFADKKVVLFAVPGNTAPFSYLLSENTDSILWT